MASVNRVHLIGHVGREPECRYTQSGTAVANFSLATNEYQGKDKPERTEWHNIVVWDKLADVAQKYITKGKQVYIEGRLQTRDWTDEQGVKRYKTEVVAINMQLLGRKDEQPADTNGQPAADEYNIGDLGAPLTLGGESLSPGD